MLVPNLPTPLPVKWLKRLNIHHLPGGLKVEDFDYMHTLIYTDEVRVISQHECTASWVYMHKFCKQSSTSESRSNTKFQLARQGSMGPSGAVTVGYAFGLPPIYKFGNQALQEKFLPDLITGKKRICIAITEPGAGSDVANIATTAKKTADGKHYIINGTKKW